MPKFSPCFACKWSWYASEKAKNWFKTNTRMITTGQKKLGFWCLWKLLVHTVLEQHSTRMKIHFNLIENDVESHQSKIFGENSKNLKNMFLKFIWNKHFEFLTHLGHVSIHSVFFAGVSSHFQMVFMAFFGNVNIFITLGKPYFMYFFEKCIALASLWVSSGFVLLLLSTFHDDGCSTRWLQITEIDKLFFVMIN